MAKKDKKDKSKDRINTDYGVYYADGKYHCDDCDHPLNIEEECPECHKQVDWDKAMTAIRTRGMG